MSRDGREERKRQQQERKEMSRYWRSVTRQLHREQAAEARAAKAFLKGRRK